MSLLINSKKKKLNKKLKILRLLINKINILMILILRIQKNRIKNTLRIKKLIFIDKIILKYILLLYIILK